MLVEKPGDLLETIVGGGALRADGVGEDAGHLALGIEEKGAVLVFDDDDAELLGAVPEGGRGVAGLPERSGGGASSRSKGIKGEQGGLVDDAGDAHLRKGGAG